ncbi:CHASE domain-containing protein [Zhengella mangrovi]|uniref:CHASE domain-containing protein n=1 Tax=Zhengella mangrovi TaxID=1982044 RepID=UPI0010566800|nr:CHASE domain-containing protein [Zhengella mangrovi]
MKRYGAAFVFLLVGLIGLAITSAVHRSESVATQARFDLVADEAVSRIEERVQQHIALLVAAASHYQADGDQLSRPSFAAFISGLGLESRFEGIQGIGYAKILQSDDDGTTRQALRRFYGIDRDVWPDSTEAVRTAILLIEPMNTRNRAALGFDMFSEKRRREAMWRALQTGEISASAPVTLVQEITAVKQAGFLVYIPVATAGEKVPDGFIYAPFRAGDLHDAALKGRPLPVELATRDAYAPQGEGLLYSTAGYDPDSNAVSFHATREFDIAGRRWQVNLHETPAFAEHFAGVYTLLTGLITFLLATAMAAATRWQQKSVAGAQALAELSESAAQEKDLLLQEMKHRIKNSIARIQAMARQTAASSDDLDGFSASFSSRLQSMANAQDLLTRSSGSGAELRDLIITELKQIYGAQLDEALITGPALSLNARQTQALALTFHELATNSLKYGAGSHPDGVLSIAWTNPGRENRALHLTWDESFPNEGGTPPERRGFGSRLIDANIRGEMHGSIERTYHAGGLTISISIPIAT